MEVTNITEEGVTFSAEVFEKGNVPITEHGFTWSFVKPQITNSERVLLGSFDGPGLFSADVTTALEPGLSYKVCAFVKAGDYTVYGNEITFASLGSEGPVLTGFEPPVVMLGDTVFFKGRNFSWILNNAYIDNIQATSYPVSDSVLKVIVPYYLTKRENIIAVEVTGNRATYTDEKLVVMLPEIASFQPSSGYWGDTITIELANVTIGSPLSVSIGNINVMPVEPFDGNRIRIVVPAAIVAAESNIQVTVQQHTATSASPFELLPPVIDHISPTLGNWSSVVTIYGHFNPTLTGTTVKFGNLTATIQSLTEDSIKVKVPATLTSPSNLVYNFGLLQCTSEQQFSFLPPEITSVTPMSDYAGGVVTIAGNNFSPSSSVLFNELSAKIISVKDNELKCYVPGGYNGNAFLKLTAGLQDVVYTEPFMMTNPMVTSFSPKEGTVGDTITIECKDYNSMTNFILSTTPGTGGYTLNKVSVNNNIVKVAIQNYLVNTGYPGAAVTRNTVNSYISIGEVFTINKPVISSFSPVSGTYGTEVTILGSNFSPVSDYNMVVIDGIGVPITYSSRNEIRFNLPAMSYSGDYPITVNVGTMSVISSGEISYLSGWSELPSLPFVCNYGLSMKFGNEVIVANGSTVNKSLYKFDPASGTFSQLNNETYTFPSLWPSVVVKGNKAYMLGYNNSQVQFYSFDYGTLTIEKVSDYPGRASGDQVLFDGDSVLYMGGGWTSTSGFNMEFYKYSLSSGHWTKLNNLPGKTCHTNEFTINGRGYAVFNDNSTYEYNPVNDTWIARARYPGYWCRFKVDVECDGKIYMGYGDYIDETPKVYDAENDIWIDLRFSGIPNKSYYLNFSIDAKLYIGGGNNQTAMRMYDPNFSL
jgi:hypothetical protein